MAYEATYSSKVERLMWDTISGKIRCVSLLNVIS